MNFDKDISRVLSKLEYGVYIISMGNGRSGNAFTASWLTQVSSEPPMIVLAVHNKHQSARMLAEKDGFVVNLLGKGDEAIAGAFYGPVESGNAKLSDVMVTPAPTTACPVIPGAIGFLDCKVVKRVPCGNHTAFIGEVLAAKLNANTEVLTSSSSRLRYCG